MHPERTLAVAKNAHDTHGRMSAVLDIDVVPVPADARGRVDLDALERVLEQEAIGTVVLTTVREFRTHRVTVTVPREMKASEYVSSTNDNASSASSRLAKAPIRTR